MVLVDNTERTYLVELAHENECALIPLSKNTGVAHAQNTGIDYALKCGANIVLYFDQDSAIGSNFVKNLLSPLDPGSPGVVSPVCYDGKGSFEFPSLIIGRYGNLVKQKKTRTNSPFCVDVVIASGTAATAETYVIAGMMDEEFYIDFVDTEWCLRCRSRGIPIYVVPSAIMKHSIGNETIDLWIMKVLIHSPVRCYYQIRNCFLLFRRRHVPIALVLTQLVTVLINRLVLMCFVRGRMDYLYHIVLAILHGIKGVSGQKPQD